MTTVKLRPTTRNGINKRVTIIPVKKMFFVLFCYVLFCFVFLSFFLFLIITLYRNFVKRTKRALSLETITKPLVFTKQATGELFLSVTNAPISYSNFRDEYCYKRIIFPLHVKIWCMYHFQFVLQNIFISIWGIQYHYSDGVGYTNYWLKKSSNIVVTFRDDIFLFEFCLTLLILRNRLPISESSEILAITRTDKIRFTSRLSKTTKK